jgi:hypothetical protein
MRRKKLLKSFGFLAVILMLASMLLMVDWANSTPAQAADKAPEKIKIGNAICLSGPFAIGAYLSQVNPYKLWVEQTNAKGGIYVPKYKKRIPVEYIVYDDRSDIETTVKAFYDGHHRQFTEARREIESHPLLFCRPGPAGQVGSINGGVIKGVRRQVGGRYPHLRPVRA